MKFLPYIMALAVLLQFIFVPAYLKKCWPKKNRISLCYKMICATLFVLTGVMCIIYSGNKSVYAILMLCGLCFSWFGDFFLHINEKLSLFITGLFFFLIGHIFYVSAYSVAAKKLFGIPVFSPIDIIIVAVLTSISVIYAVKTKIHFGRAAVPALIYTIALTSMMVKACHLAVAGLVSDAAVWTVPAILLISGSVMFCMSDTTLALINFGDKKIYGVKIFNIITYFAAQMCLAYTILFIK